MLTLNRTIEDNLFEFIDDGWLFNYMDEIDVKLKDYKDKAWINKEHSNRNEIYIMLELDTSKYKLTETFKVDRIEELKDYYDKITENIKSNF
jgi:hypothetical protein